MVKSMKKTANPAVFFLITKRKAAPYIERDKEKGVILIIKL